MNQLSEAAPAGVQYCPRHPMLPLVQINGACAGLKCPACTYHSIEISLCPHPQWQVLRREAGGWVECCTTCGHERFVPIAKFQEKMGGGKMKGITHQSKPWRIHAILAANKTQCGLAIAECQEDMGPVNCGRCLKCLSRQLRTARRKINGRRLKRGQLTFSVV